MSDNLKFLGSSKVSSKLRISVVQDVAKEMDLQDGDFIMFYKGKAGEIVIRKG
jgi:hypothetical protein